MHSISGLVFSEVSAGTKMLENVLPSPALLCKRKEVGAFRHLAWPSTSPLTLPLGAPHSHRLTTCRQRFPLLTEAAARVWRAAFLPSDPPPFLVPTPPQRRLTRNCLCREWLSLPLSPRYHPVLPSSWLCCCNKWELFPNVAQRCL